MRSTRDDRATRDDKVAPSKQDDPPAAPSHGDVRGKGDVDPDEAATRAADLACVERALAGDQRAFEEIYERHRETVFKVAFGVVRNAEDALDIAQETFLKAYRCLGRFERRSSLLTWLCQIAIHRAIDLTRRKKVRKATELEEFMMGERDARGGGVALAADGKARPHELDPGTIAQGDELKAALQGALGRLSSKHRDVFVLYTVKGLSYREIATKLGVQIGTVMSRLFYARKHLQEMLKEFQDSSGRDGALS